MDCNSTLVFQVYAAQQARPIQNAKVTVTQAASGTQRALYTNSSGRTAPLCLFAPDASLSLEPFSIEEPYGVCDAEVEADGYITVRTEGIQLFAGVESLQELELNPVPVNARTAPETELVVIPPPALRQAEPRQPEGPLVESRLLTEVFIPKYITVHLGAPNNTSASNVTVSFISYIKNVASSEIYPTWPESALRANIYAQITFALNRIYTEWYTSRGYSFNITNNTAYDQYFVYGRNIFDNISSIVDGIFNRYIRRQGFVSPIFSAYCNGTTATCSGLSQWGTVTLAQNGYTPLNILKNYYGSDIELGRAGDTRVLASSYPGSPLRLGSSSSSVTVIENQLNRIRRSYPAIPQISSVDANFTAETQSAVKAFQSIFSLTADGIVGPATWNKISYIYVAVKQLAELGGESEPLPDSPPTVIIKQGSTGSDVKLLQYMLEVISKYYSEVRAPGIDGIFGTRTAASVRDFQQLAGVAVDGIVGPNTWQALYNVFLGITDTSGLVVAYPGTPLKEGSRGANVLLVQEYLNYISRRYAIPTVAEDGIFGPATKAAVIEFQELAGLEADGIVGPKTWEALIATRLLI